MSRRDTSFNASIDGTKGCEFDYFQPAGQSAVPLEATAQDKFKIDPAVVFEFDAAKGQMTIKRDGVERVFTKEKQQSEKALDGWTPQQGGAQRTT
jgi:hypothetical protein